MYVIELGVFKKGFFESGWEIGFGFLMIFSWNICIYINLLYVKILLYVYFWYNLKIYLIVLCVMDNFKNLCNILVWILLYEDYLKKILKILILINIIF